jgi:hypothetical protein
MGASWTTPGQDANRPFGTPHAQDALAIFETKGDKTGTERLRELVASLTD